MEKTSHVPKSAHSVTNEKNHPGDGFARSTHQRNLFLNMALNMSWQLAIAVLVPILAGVKLDKTFSTGSVYTFVGLGLALIGSIAVMWRTMQVANRLPVPKLTDAQKRAIRKSYEDEDKDE